MDKEDIMIKKIGTALLCAALGTTLYARDDISTSKLFIGLELESTKVGASSEYQITDDFYNVLASEKYSDTFDSTIEYGLRVGAEKDDWRTTLLYTYYSDSQDATDVTMHKGSLLLDYFLWSTGSEEYTIKPYLGAHVGYMSYEVTGYIPEFAADQVFADDTGLFYGGQVGLAMTISEVVQLDLSYKYSLTSIESVTNLEYYPAKNLYLDVIDELDDMGTIAFSINYFY